MRNPVTISLIIPIYRVEKYIGRFAESVFGQTYPHIQYIFVNDETDDATVHVLKTLIDDRYSHLKDKILIVDQPHAGLPAARNTGMQYAAGDYVWHVDSDDWIEDDAVAMIAAVAEKSDSDLIYFSFRQEYADGSRIKREKVYDISSKNEYVWNMFNQKSYACVWNKCIRRSVYERHKIHFPEYSYAEDAYLMIQLVSYCNSIASLDSALYHYRKDNSASLSHQKRKHRRLEYALNFMNLYEKLNNINEAVLSEHTAGEIDLSKCRVITSDVKDIRGELEASSCLEYNGELTRVQVRTVIIRETENGREFLAKKFRYRTSLPGGGYDQEKDNGDILKTAKREALEEFNFILSNVEDTGVRT
jgi:glycosyltransferase involved in cell wall biosynthesis